uniref:Uncharacterized protein n=1 Tax=Fopius arisanus TaxID=64838 RepID=A0A0C9RWQ7_9HYME
MACGPWVWTRGDSCRSDMRHDLEQPGTVASDKPRSLVAVSVGGHEMGRKIHLCQMNFFASQVLRHPSEVAGEYDLAPSSRTRWQEDRLEKPGRGEETANCRAQNRQ